MYSAPPGRMIAGPCTLGGVSRVKGEQTMKHFARCLFAFAALMVVVPAAVHGHFRLIEPASWIMENERGDPQKAGPCGGTNTDWGKPSNVLGKAVGGQKLHIRVQE